MTDLGESVLIIVAVVWMVMIIINIYWLSDHSGWENKVYNPDPNATITNIEQKKVQYLINHAKFKTTVTFSDGFYYISHKTNRDSWGVGYTISINKAITLEIVEKAIKAHKNAVETANQKK